MKKLFIAVTLLLGLSAMANNSHNLNYNHNDRDRYSNPHPSYKTHTKGKSHFVNVVRNKPIYRKTRSQHRHPHAKRHAVGYRNITYWRGQKITRISNRPLHKFKVKHQRQHRGHTARH